MTWIDPSMPASIEFSNLEYLTMSFQDGSNKNYDLFYFVNTNESEQPPRVVLTIQGQQRVELIFSPEATIGIKNSTLYYNPIHLTKSMVESLPCKRTTDGMHKWEEKQSFTKMKIITCESCGHTRILATDELIKQWEKNGFIK